MKHVVVRYKLKADRVAEHEALLQGVFEELTERAPEGLAYNVFKLGDGLTFHHVAMIAAGNPLASLDAFKRFVAEIGSRCDEPPVSSEGTLMGSYAAHQG